MVKRDPRTRWVMVILWLAVAAGQVSAMVVPEPTSPVAEKQFRHPDLRIDNVYQRADELPSKVRSRLDALGVEAGHAFIDPRSGRWGTLLLSQPLLPGRGNRLAWKSEPPGDEETLGRAAWEALVGFLEAHRPQLLVDPDQLPEMGEVRVGDNGTVIRIHGRRLIAGIPVRASFLSAVVNHGNLVLLGAHGWGEVEVSTAPALPAAAAEREVEQRLLPQSVAGTRERTELVIVPTAFGEGYDYRLAWVVRPRIAGETAAWEALVDAHSGEILSFEDVNQYAATTRQVMGGVLPTSNDGVPPGGVEQPRWPMPFAALQQDGGPLGPTSHAGYLPVPVDGDVTFGFESPYVDIYDLCGGASLTSSGDVDMGTNTGTDCATPGFGGPGNTRASRTSFYHVNRMKETARGYLPANPWLVAQLVANVNLIGTCNAYWNGSTLNFYRSGGGCPNTGEIASIIIHEWGHGMDGNDTTPGISNPGEGIADLYTALRINNSCIGEGLRPGIQCSGYGDPCIDCDGIRDIDWARHASGLPHDVPWADVNCGSGGFSPCGGSSGCEGQIVAEAVWDLLTRDLPASYGMDFNTALAVTTRLTYLGAGGVGTWFQCTSPYGGCSAAGGYLNYLAVDDDNGNINDGTPHMSAIFAAFDRHDLACNVPLVVDSGCPGIPTTAPVVTATPIDHGVTLAWDPVAGATRYQIYRTEGVYGCDYGKIKAGETNATAFTDTDLKNEFEYYYVVLGISTADTCMGPASSCVSVIPGGPPVCDEDGVCETGEDCDNCSADCPAYFNAGAVCGNGICEAGDGEDCINCPADCNGLQKGGTRKFFCCANGGGINPVPCSDPRCSTGGWSCTEVPQGPPYDTCCGDLVCEPPEDGVNCPLDCP